MEQRLSIITLGVKDLKEAEQFYTEKFGWNKAEESNENIIFMQLNGIKLALYANAALAEDANVEYKETGHGSYKGFTLAFCTRTEQEVDELFENFEKQNVNIVKRPEKVFWGGYSGYIADPDGNLWEIAFNPYLQIDEVGNIK
ncbi:VOC family protein [Fulvivirga kasyanovii]|uniref:VOC family protein n=1 Tax=Fulvivirga kasyanovii TaxID=396812 RepID=A0ABW9RRJ4_9BACT|nr:VOC family protein [Fulvivirga kasyanovii]MTI26656.1 VOC family protein [Fulvivirga kasyanovii]